MGAAIDGNSDTWIIGMRRRQRWKWKQCKQQ